MSKIKTEICEFRMRSYNCPVCSHHTTVMGQDPEPTVCFVCGASKFVKEWDQWIKTTKVTEPYSAHLTDPVELPPLPGSEGISPGTVETLGTVSEFTNPSGAV